MITSYRDVLIERIKVSNVQSGLNGLKDYIMIIRLDKDRTEFWIPLFDIDQDIDKSIKDLIDGQLIDDPNQPIRCMLFEHIDKKRIGMFATSHADYVVCSLLESYL